MAKELSIICPVLNCWPITERMINSISVSEDYDLIIVDNGSTDGTLDNLRAMAEKNGIPFEVIDGDTVSLTDEERKKATEPPTK